MATTSYETALHIVGQLTPDERRRLQDVLANLQTDNTPLSNNPQPSGAALVAMLDAQPSDPVVWEEIERIIEDECERRTMVKCLSNQPLANYNMWLR